MINPENLGSKEQETEDENKFQSQESENLHDELEKTKKLQIIRGGLVDKFSEYEIWGEIEGLLNNLENDTLNGNDFVSKLFELNNRLEVEENIKELNRGTIREISKTLELGQEKAA